MKEYVKMLLSSTPTVRPDADQLSKVSIEPWQRGKWKEELSFEVGVINNFAILWCHWVMLKMDIKCLGL